jgi:2-polyprenyl-6-methoxyphenol hydroxylase-like FAD-dependent oxidoreductase
VSGISVIWKGRPVNATRHSIPPTDVLIVGAGPVGLMAASELARNGASVRVVDNAPGPTRLSKALVIHARTLEALDLAGLAERFTEKGYPAPGLDVGLGSHRPVSVNMKVLDTRFPYMLVLPQRETEAILRSRVGELGVTVERGAEFTGVTQDGDAVAATIRLAGREGAGIAFCGEPARA